eukprot:CAMPEP_0119276252 /NCGR_PEP_ID=MMETSP1329-20130426/15108_1 /TAXON_ID=114041 /ORGANISM="Genus nov. species nov., Strain RCC1024" /LENGTH=208 /DNA_ID=CAMNT_0007276679 /DNA_START=213 /DNA_END=835 /DNA_ORIENTATION=-
MPTKRVVVDDGDSRITYTEGVLGDAARKALYETLAAAPWRVETDEWGKQGRPTFYMGDERAVFAFCGLRLEPDPWPPAVLKAREAVAEACGVDPALLTGCLANCYPAGEGSIPWHHDEVRAHGDLKIVASLSLGGPRLFRLRRKGRPEVLEELDLAPGSLLLMRGRCQEQYEHELPLVGDAPPRISLTFRSIVPGFEGRAGKDPGGWL